ncbi:MAG: c-type cytochrome [Beijerinckiaceae bacterium]
MTRSSLLPLVVLLAGASLPAFGQGPSAGQSIAEASCGACHQIYGDRSSAASANSGPSFQAISRMPSTTQLSIKVFLQTPHANMPNLILSREEIDALAAYIVTLSPR